MLIDGIIVDRFGDKITPQMSFGYTQSMSEWSSSIARECSPFLDGLITRQPQWFEDLKQQGRLNGLAPPASGELESTIDKHGLDTGLRKFRNREMLRITWRELNRLASLEETMSDLSLLAEHCLQASSTHHHDQLISRFGTPRDSEGQGQKIVIISMGKLGGAELNLSSDIDIVFAFPEAGKCDGRGRISNEQFFIKLARQIVRSLSDVSEHGFCFRVDTRLRPFGESGPLVCSFGAMEQYYQRKGRGWERYALIKARPVAGDLQGGADLLSALAPFVYRRYIDFGAVEILHEMYRALREASARKGRAEDIKRGPGGIREIEFLVQAFQLLRGGREPGLRTPSLLTALLALERLEILPAETAQSLQRSYEFLRRLENAIQALHDLQTPLLPPGDDLERVAQLMRFNNAGSLLSALEDTRKRISAHIEVCFPERLSPDENTQAQEQWPAIKSGIWHPGEPMEGCLKSFTATLSRLSLSNRAAQRLDQFMPGLLARLDDAGFTRQVLTDVLNLVLAICRRSAYLSLLVQNPSALNRMLSLFAESDWVSRVVIRHPALLDELIDPGLGKLLPDEQEMQLTAQRILDSKLDTESTLLALNHMKLAFGLRIAVAELETTLSARQVQRSLSRLAEAIIHSCHVLALKDVEAKHGGLPGNGIAIIGYGSLGAEELSYGSDLELIFLYEQADDASDGKRPLEPERFHTAVVRRLLSFLISSTASGRLFEVDTRLRPNGRSGLLVSSIAAFEKYQKKNAWIWELQALTRARPCAGSTMIGQVFVRLREEILQIDRDPKYLQSRVKEMRSRLREAHPAGDDFKHGEGGLIDIDFVAQLGVLTVGSSEFSVTGASGTHAQLQALKGSGWIGSDQYQSLIEALASLTRARHMALLSRSPADASAFLAASRDICRSYLHQEN